MSSRDEATDMIMRICPSHLDPYFYAAKMADLFDRHAHELAEKQRAWAESRYGSAPTLGVAKNTVYLAADQIDSEVQ